LQDKVVVDPAVNIPVEDVDHLPLFSKGKVDKVHCGAGGGGVTGGGMSQLEPV
jgi:hypothetical protein